MWNKKLLCASIAQKLLQYNVFVDEYVPTISK